MKSISRDQCGVPVLHEDHSMALLVPVPMLDRNAEFFRGYSSAKGRITPTRTYTEVDSIKQGGRDMGEQYARVGKLFGMIRTYQAYIYLRQEFGDVVPKDVLYLLRSKYD